MLLVTSLAIISIAAASALFLRHLVIKSFQDATTTPSKARANKTIGATQARISNMLRKTGQFLQPDDEAESRSQLKLTQAGLAIDAISWRGIQAVAIVVAVGVAIWLAATLRIPFSGSVVVCALCVGAGFLGPQAFLATKKKSRQKAIAGALPNALELLNTAVRSGYPLERGIRLVGENASGALGEEFRRVDREVSLLGMQLEDALTRMKKRCDVPCVTTFCNSLIHARKQGTSITRTLNVQAKSVQEQHYTDLLVQINQLPNKMVPIIFVVFFPIIIALSVVPVAYNAMSSLAALA